MSRMLTDPKQSYIDLNNDKLNWLNILGWYLLIYNCKKANGLIGLLKPALITIVDIYDRDLTTLLTDKQLSKPNTKSICHLSR